MSYDYPAIINGLVTNRTSAVNYGVSDFNRVEYAVEAMAAALRETGDNYTPSTQTTWENTNTWGNWPSAENMKRYLRNVRVLYVQTGFKIPSGVPATMEYLNYNGANAIEKALGDYYTYLQQAISEYKYCSIRTFCGT